MCCIPWCYAFCCEPRKLLKYYRTRNTKDQNQNQHSGKNGSVDNARAVDEKAHVHGRERRSKRRSHSASRGAGGKERGRERDRNRDRRQQRKPATSSSSSEDENTFVPAVLIPPPPPLDMGQYRDPTPVPDMFGGQYTPPPPPTPYGPERSAAPSFPSPEPAASPSPPPRPAKVPLSPPPTALVVGGAPYEYARAVITHHDDLLQQADNAADEQQRQSGDDQQAAPANSEPFHPEWRRVSGSSTPSPKREFPPSGVRHFVPAPIDVEIFATPSERRRERSVSRVRTSSERNRRRSHSRPRSSWGAGGEFRDSHHSLYSDGSRRGEDSDGSAPPMPAGLGFRGGGRRPRRSHTGDAGALVRLVPGVRPGQSGQAVGSPNAGDLVRRGTAPADFRTAYDYEGNEAPPRRMCSRRQRREAEDKEGLRLRKEQEERENAIRLRREQEERENATRLRREQEERENAIRLRREQEERENAIRLRREQEERENAIRLRREQEERDNAVRLRREQEEAIRQMREQEEREHALRMRRDQEERENAIRLRREQEERENAIRLRREQEERENAVRLRREQEEAIRQMREQEEREHALRTRRDQEERENATRQQQQQDADAASRGSPTGPPRRAPINITITRTVSTRSRTNNPSNHSANSSPAASQPDHLQQHTPPDTPSAPPKSAHRRWRGFPKLGFAYVEEGPLPITFEDHMESLSSHIAEHSLEGVIPDSSSDPLEIAKRAEAEADRICAALGLSPYATPDLTKVGLYDVIVFCDDSGSMLVDNRFDDQRDVVKRISRIAHTYNRAGISLRFINFLDDDGYNRLSHGDINSAISHVFPNGTTRLGTKLLEKVVLPFVIEPARRGELRRPVLISMITDGEVLSLPSSPPLRSTANVFSPLQPTEENVDTLKWTILACKDELRKNLNAHGTPYGESAVTFQINRIGDSPESKKYLDRLADDPEIAGLIHCNDETLDAAVRTAGGDGGQLNTWVRSPPLIYLSAQQDEKQQPTDGMTRNS